MASSPIWAAIVLAAMLGGIGLPGGGFAFGHGSTNGIGVPRIDVPGPELPLPLNPARTVIPVARMADMLLDPGARYAFNGRQYTYPDVKLIYWAGGNPFHHHQDLNRLARAWQKPETVVVHDSWWTPTVRHADIVLPATTTLERNDVGGSSRDPFILAMHRAIDPVGEARNDFDIFRALAQRLGYEAAFTEGRDEMAWCRWIYDSGARERGCEGRRPAGLPAVLGGRVRRAASARARLRAVRGFSPRSGAPSAEDAVGTHRDRLRSDRRLRLRGLPAASVLDTASRVARRRGGRALADPPGDASAGQPLHSQQDPGPVSRRSKIAGREPMRINPADAARRGIADGDVVRVFNSRGACLAGALLDPGVMPGVVVMATGAWFDPSGTPGEPERHGNPNVLTLDIGTSPLAQGTSALTALVEIERWDAPAPAVRAFTPPVFAAAG